MKSVRVIPLMLLALVVFVEAVGMDRPAAGQESASTGRGRWATDSDQAGALFGAEVASAGDVNADGYADVIVGAPYYSNGQQWEGRAFLYLGSASGLPTTPNWTAESNQTYASFGASVASAGDVNGDGYDDVIVGASFYSNGQEYEGRAFVYHGSASGLSTSPDWTAESDKEDALFGGSVASAGDVNGDGYADVIVGASRYINRQGDEGRAFVYLGSASGLSTSPNWTAEFPDGGFAQFGAQVASAGDVNADGYDEVIVGAPFAYGQRDKGRALVYNGSVTGLSTTPDWTAESDQPAARFGYSVASAGDVNGDGYADVIVGSYAYDNPVSDAGRAFLYHGSASGLSTAPDWTAGADQFGASFGISVASAGDLNGDGYADVIVGSSLYDQGQGDEGMAFLFHGSATGLSSTADQTAEADQESAQFGNSVASAGDINGDGYADAIVGAVLYDKGETDEGAVFVYKGRA